ncbi:peptidylprolyl isomerase [Mycoplasmatota bacterium WC30]
MKRLYILGILLVLALTGCGASTTTIEENVDLTALPYYSYLSDTNPVITINVKDFGVMQLQLFPDVAKNTVDNLIHYIQEGSYSNSTFHRIIEDFMIQGGIVSDTGCSIKGEFSSNGVDNDLSHSRGVISMARTIINDSATSQFFIVHNDSKFLDTKYAAFGGLVSGFNVLDALAIVSTTTNDAPTDNIVIESITIELNGYTVDDVICAN